MSQNPLDSTDPALRCTPGELKRLKVFGGIGTVMSLFVIAMATTFGDMPRAFVDRMNVVLAPLVATSLILCSYVVWGVHRFRAADSDKRAK